MKTFLALTLLTFVAQASLADDPPAAPVQGACKAVREACLKAGFKPNSAAEGIGLFNHCVKPLVLKKPQPKTAKKPLPKGVKKADLDKCKAGMPNMK